MDSVLPFAYTVYDWKEIFDEDQRLSYLKSEEFRPFNEIVLERVPTGFERHPDLTISPAHIILKNDTEIIAEIHALSDAVLVFRSVFYPRWKAKVDGKTEWVIPANHAFSGIFIKKGKHKVHFFYDKHPHRFFEILSITVLLGLIAGNIFLWRAR